VGCRASYIVNRYINYSNYCILSCQFCSFDRKKRDADGFQLTVEECPPRPARRCALASPNCTLWAGCTPPLPFSYYTDMLKALRALDARLQFEMLHGD